ncbi:thiolase C-terminal domain-containing protein [Acuticoccus sediminis]|uniref:thiolase C-terminal domain-containing protein n=1 Tax=Acuticoccus sediminis TaxID=2184697 RepID=UPI001CFED913|nr:thiolase family protein [Acuticoccus sediminis]
MRDEAVIVGVGTSRLGRVPDTGATALMAEAALAALADAGLAMSDVDGLVTTPLRTEALNPPATLIASALGIAPAWLATLDLAGASGTAMIDQAVQAVESGRCHTVLCVTGQNLLSFQSSGSTIGTIARSGVAHPEFEAPLGPLIPSLYALAASEHIARYGTTEAQMAEVAVAIRAHAAGNPAAHKQRPITVEDVLSSAPVSTPLKRLDCSLISDGAAAVIVTTRARAAEIARAVRVAGSGYGQRHGHVGEAETLTATGAVESGRRAFAAAGIGPKDIDVAELYDCFTITVILELEDLGFCEKGEGGAFVEGGRIGPGSALPVTTHGGLLSACHCGVGGGLLHLVEGVTQLRGEAGVRQVDGARTALVHGNGGILGVHCTLILEGAA